jgi:hypothetical protein
MDISMKEPETVRYYAVPPCPVSPNWVEGMKQPPSKFQEKKESRHPTPPVNQMQASRVKDTGIPPVNLMGYRKVQENSMYTKEEETILQVAQKILQQKGSGPGTSQDTPTRLVETYTPQGSEGSLKNVSKREGPNLFQFGKGTDAMKTEEEVEFTLVDPNLESLEDHQLLEELQKLEVRAHAVQLTLQNRAFQKKQ